MLLKKSILNYSIQNLIPNYDVDQYDQVFFFGDSYLLLTLKNHEKYLIYDTINEKLFDQENYFSKRSKISASFLCGHTNIVTIHQPEHEDKSKGHPEEESEHAHSEQEKGMDDTTILLYNVWGNVRRRQRLWTANEVPQEVQGLYCGDDWIVMATTDKIYRCSYLDLQLSEMKPTHSNTILPGQKSSKSLMKKNILLLVSKNNKSFQVWNVDNGDCLMEHSNSDAFAIITMEYVAPSQLGPKKFTGSRGKQVKVKPLVIVVANTRSKCYVYTTERNDPVVLDQKFISAIHISGKEILLGDVKNGVYFYHLGKKLQTLTPPKAKNEDELTQMNAGIFSVHLVGDYALCGSNRGIEIWNTQATNETKPLSKLKIHGVVTQIFQNNHKVYFLTKKDTNFSEIVVWQPPSNIFNHSAFPPEKPNQRRSEKSEKSHQYHKSEMYSASESFDNSIEGSFTDTNETTSLHSSESKEGILSKMPKFNIFRGKQAEANSNKRRGSHPHNVEVDEEGNTEREKRKKVISNSTWEGSEASEAEHSAQENRKSKKHD
eukprot:TRINITY_DN3099_c0_g1_i2.p1 TRINITY_DN3099_c0_g1~~TRINITY_DN3099_c0_g1_i2.p1  ORF type:complete len:545 (+),score=109.20 TRINITY_DN3099_c0_g1_i2:172-1806(+)